jgi:hypothetical protein
MDDSNPSRAHSLEQTSLIGHFLGFAKLERLSQDPVLAHHTRMLYIDHRGNRFKLTITHSFENTRSTLGVPPLDIATELFAGIEDAIVVFLVVQGPSNRVSEHALR